MRALGALFLAALVARGVCAPFHVAGASPAEQLLLREGQKALAAYSERAAAEAPGALQRLAGKRGCWTSAVATLRADCARLDDDGTRRLALALANCALEASGERTYPCAEAKAFKDCTRGMSEKAWTSYSAAQGQATAVCFFLAAESFHTDAAESVDRLQAASSRASGALDALGAGLSSSLELQSRVAESQMAVADGLRAVRDSQAGLEQLQLSALDGQQQLLDGQSALAESAAAAAGTLDAVAAATQAANEQLGELFEAHRTAARATLQQLHALSEGAAALEAAQARLGSAQRELLAASAAVADRQHALAGTLDSIGTTLTALAFWQQRLARAMSLVLGAAFTLDDVAWTAGALGAASAATSIPRLAAARPALMLALAGSACAERALVPWLVTSTAAARATLAAGGALAQRSGGGVAAIAARDALTAFAARLERAEVKWALRHATSALCAALLARAAWRYASAAAQAAQLQAEMEQRLQRSLSDALEEHERRLFDALRHEIAASPAFRRAMEPNAFLEATDMPPLPRTAPPATMRAPLARQQQLALPPPALPFESAIKPAGHTPGPATAGATMLVTPSPHMHSAPALNRGAEPETARARLDAVLEQAAAQSGAAPPQAAVPPPASRGASHAEPAAEPQVVPPRRKRAAQSPVAESPAKRAARTRSGQCSGA